MHRTLPATLGVGGLCAHFQMGDTGRRRPSDLPKATLPADSRTRDGAQTWSGKLQLSGGGLQSVAGIGWGGGGGGLLIPVLRMVGRTQYTRLARGLALGAREPILMTERARS